jgi:hypothetical protein
MSWQASDGSSTGGKLAKMLGTLGAAWSKTSAVSKTRGGAPIPKPGEQSSPSQATMPSSPTAAPAAAAAAAVQRPSDDMEDDDQVLAMPGPSLTPQRQQDILDKAAAEGLPLVVPPGYNKCIIMPRGPPARQGSIEKLLGAMCLAPLRDDLPVQLATQTSQESAMSSGSGGSSMPGATSRQGSAEGHDGGAVKRSLLARLAG